ncbi:putative lipid II flippase FtsW [Candidatus Spongiihabitans sp.]|uniref:putative lipid II flippase FtsW n=1 Tax=Candidatus Spongiihabitans sp. TaxID=3101308 RepID=UPI003C6FDB8E
MLANQAAINRTAMNRTAMNTRATAFQANRVSEVSSYDQWLMFTVIALLSLSVVMVYSATITVDSRTLDINFNPLIKHLLHIGLGSVLLFMAASIRMNWLAAASKALLLIGLLLLVVVLFPGVGVEVNGSIRWIDLGGIRFQPSEFMKIAGIIYFADYLARKREDLHLFKVGIINTGLVVGAIGVLLLLEPDFGTAVVITTAIAGMMFLAGVRFWHFLIGLSMVVMLLASIMWMEPYRVARLLSYRDPWADPYGNGFQLIQALIAIGRGEWFGVGLGSSIQKLFYLPHASNDFLIAIIGEELGAVGIFGVLTLFTLLLFRAFAISHRALQLGQRFSGFLAQGIGLLFALQAGVHIGVNTGLLPTKGITLPMMSHGGSSMLISMAAVGLLFAVDRQSRPQPGGRRCEAPDQK